MATQVQLGGLIYFTLLGIIALVLINFLPLVNFVFQVLFDGCVACTAVVREKNPPVKRKRPASISNAPTPRIKGVVARSRRGAATDAPVAIGANVDDVHLTAQQLRAVKRTRRSESLAASAPGAEGASFGQRLRRISQRLVRLGEPLLQPEQAHLLDDEAAHATTLKQEP